MKLDFEKLQVRVKEFWSDNYNKIFLGILVFAFAIRLFYFFKTMNQPLWWDEADYVAIAKYLANGVPYTIDSIRFSFYNLIHACIFKIGLGENFIRFLNILISMFSVILVYSLGKNMFNKRIGIIASAFMSVFWLELFSNTRIFMEVPSIFIWLLSIFILVKYEKTNNGRFLWLLSFLLVISFLVKYSAIVLIASVIIYFLLTHRLKVFKNKDYWIASGIGLGSFFAYFVALFFYYGTLFEGIFKSVSGMHGISLAPTVSRFSSFLTSFKLTFSFFPNYFYLLYLAGFLILIFYICLRFDLIRRDFTSKNYFFVLILFSVFLFIFVMGEFVDNRQIVSAIIPCIFLFSFSLEFIYKKIE